MHMGEVPKIRKLAPCVADFSGIASLGLLETFFKMQFLVLLKGSRKTGRMGAFPVVHLILVHQMSVFGADCGQVCRSVFTKA